MEHRNILLRISDMLYRLSSGWLTLSCLGIFMIFTATVLPRQASQAEATSPGTLSPDTSFFYTPAQLYQAAEEYGTTGRQAYIYARFTFDIIWPLIYLSFLTTSISWLLGRGLPANSRWRLLNLLPLAAVLFDLLENSATSMVMLRYPAETPLIDWLAPLFTATKWMLVVACFIVLLVSVALYISSILRRQRQGKPTI